MPCAAAWRALPGEVRHALSGFEARVTVFEARLESGPPDALWRTPEALAGEALAGLARKLLAHGVA
jgi:hypothetical protein